MAVKVALISVLIGLTLSLGSEPTHSTPGIPGPGDLVCQLFPALCE